MKKLLFPILTLASFQTVLAQMTEIKYKVHINGKVKQVVDTAIFGAAGSYRKIDILNGYANIVTDKLGDSLLVNYWLDGKITPPSGYSLTPYFGPASTMTVKSFGSEDAPVDETVKRGSPVDKAIFTIIRPKLDSLFLIQKELKRRRNTFEKTTKLVKTKKDSLGIYSDTLLYSWKDQKKVVDDLKRTYLAAYNDNANAKQNFEDLKEFYGKYIERYQKLLNDHNTGWLPLDSSKIYKAIKATDTIIYAVKYDPTTDYIIKLNNREYKSFYFTSWDAGAVTIPFKYRFSYHKNNVAISDQFTADVNVGAFFGRSLGWVKYKYRRGYDLKPGTWKFTIGGFASPSITEIDSSSTSGDIKPLSSKKTIGAASLGGGIMISAYDFKFGIFSGTDIGIGDDARKWNYNNKLWIGLGLGYSLSSLTFNAK
ncbi:MAG: hypothetical protein JST26_19800 [Bacteroidetes bacterium]|nr:hypothetical protein [Bacteroidota bacterium]